MPDSPEHVLPRVSSLIERGIQHRLHLGVQGYVSLRGEVLADFAIGENAPGEPLTTDTLMLWLSAGKPLTAVAILRLVEARQFQLDAPVASIIEEFGQAGKADVTFAHLLAHVAGLKPIATGWPHLPWDEIVAKICNASLRHGATAGSYAGYDPARSWFILGEAVRRVDGRPVEQFVREEICERCGMENSWLAVPEEVFHDRQRTIGVSYTAAEGQFTPTKSHLWETCRWPSPGGSLRGPIRELGRFYEAVLRGWSAGWLSEQISPGVNAPRRTLPPAPSLKREGGNLSGDALLKPATIRDMTSRQREGRFDETFQHVVDFGWGIIINSNRYGADTIPYGFGRHASETTFGHGGAQSSIGFADPEHQLVVALVANGLPGEAEHNERFRELNTAIYEDLGLVGK